MKLTLFLPIFSLLFSGCQPSIENKNTPDDNSESINSITEIRFFEYDAIDHYFKANAERIWEDQPISEIDSLKKGVIIGDTPKNLHDLFFIDKLEEIGYRKASVNKSKFEEIDEIFSERTPTEVYTSACIYIYRDILIFKKNNKVVGTAKICFECMGHSIRGTTADTHYFGQEGDYLKLEKLLH